jgi:sugar phosphate isomerase/epimerase
MRLGIDSYMYHLHFGKHSDIENPEPVDVWWFLAEVVRLGLEGVQIDPFHLPTDEVDKIADFVGQHGLYVEHSMGTIRADVVKENLAIARRLGAKAMRCFVGGEFERDPEAHQAKLSRAVSELGQCVETADRLGVTIAIENHGDIRAEGLMHIMDELRHDRVGVCFDVGNTLAVGDDPVEACRMVGGHIVATHFSDRRQVQARGKTFNVGVALGEGEIDLAGALEVIRAHARTGTNITLEVPFAAHGSVAESLRHEREGVEHSVRFARDVLGIGHESESAPG